MDAILAALQKRPSGEAGFWELIQEIRWDRDFGHLGKLTDFVAVHADQLEAKHGVLALKTKYAAASIFSIFFLQPPQDLCNTSHSTGCGFGFWWGC